MLKPGLVSISFRSLRSDEIIGLTVDAGLAGIEWGGDTHVRHGDYEAAQRVGELTREAGLVCAAYGSYYRFDDVLGDDSRGNQALGFSTVAATAQALGAPLVRIWAGSVGSGDCPPEVRSEIVASSREAGDTAAAHGLRVAFEFHGGTLTDTAASAAKLLEDIDHPNVGTLWQPPVGSSPTDCRDGLRLVKPWVSNVHCFNWGPGGRSDAAPLADAADTWRSYLAELPPADERWVLLEFMPNDDPAELAAEAATLREVVG